MEEYVSTRMEQLYEQFELIVTGLKYCSLNEQRTKNYRVITHLIADMDQILTDIKTDYEDSDKYWIHQDLIYRTYKMKAMIYNHKSRNFIIDNDLHDPICEIFNLIPKIINSQH